MKIVRSPAPALRPFVTRLWAIDETRPFEARATRERVLPTGMMHLAIRLGDCPLRVFDSVDAEQPITVAHAVVGGARSTFYVRDTSRPVSSVGAMLYPGAAQLLLGVPAVELGGRHVDLADLWGKVSGELRERLAEAPAVERLGMFERFLAARLPRVRGIHPAVALALERFAGRSAVGAVAVESGYSQRRFIEIFHQSVGLTPKRYCRVQRFQRALRLAASPQSPSWSAVAAEAGYSDQPHFTREFVELAGIAPGRYRASLPPDPNHVPVTGARG